MSALDVVCYDAKIAVLHQIVGAGAHEVVALAIECLVVGITGGRASLVASFGRASPRSRPTGTE